jgi:hypothetical protein
MMEPGVYHENPWMFKGLDKYEKVYSPIKRSPNTILSHGYMGWYFQHNWQFLSQLPVPEKTRSISCIASGQKQLKGHRLRTSFVDMLRNQKPQIDFFGKGSNYLPDKLDGLLPYRFSIAIENTSAPYYFTEKINDCFSLIPCHCIMVVRISGNISLKNLSSTLISLIRKKQSGK